MNMEAFKKYEIVGMNSTNKLVFLNRAEIELIKISNMRKKMPMIQSPKRPQAATPSVKKKFALAF